MYHLKILLNLGAGLPDWKQDEEVQCEDEALKNRLVRMGVAIELPPVRVTQEDRPVKAETTKTEPTRKADKK